LEAYRKINSDESTILNYFDEREIHPLNVHIDKDGMTTDAVYALVKKFVGKAHNYGPTPEEVTAMKKQEEEEQVRNQTQSTNVSFPNMSIW
jgi:adenylate kinase